MAKYAGDVQPSIRRKSAGEKKKLIWKRMIKEKIGIPLTSNSFLFYFLSFFFMIVIFLFGYGGRVGGGLVRRIDPHPMDAHQTERLVPRA